MTPSPRPLVTGFTIDPPKACDLDDAIDVHKHQQGWRVLVSIADVAEQVQAGCINDQEARQRAFTRYLVDANDPMLPQDLSADRLSLLPDQVRDTLTFRIDLDTCLKITGIEIEKTRLRSAAQLTHAAVSEVLDTPEHPRHGYWREALELAYGLFEQRQKRGALAVFDLAKLVRSTEEGKLVRMTQGLRHRAHLIVQELMILVNHTVTGNLLERGVTLLLRNHTTRQADVRKLYLRELAGMAHTPSDAVLEQMNQQVGHLLERARYSPVNQGHVGLGLPYYAHWTSPIRRYADLVNHRLLRAWLDHQKPPYSQSDLEAIGVHLGEVADSVRETRHLTKKRDSLETLSQTDDDALVQLGGKAMSRLLKHLLRGTIEWSAARAAEVHRRLSQDALTAADITRLLLAPDREGLWPGLKEATLQWLTHHPEQVFQVFNGGHHFYGWTPLDELAWDDGGLGPSHKPLFSMKVSIVYEGQRITSQAAISTSKLEAQQWAVLSLLSRLAGVDFTLPDAMTETARELSSPAFNSKNRLTVREPGSPAFNPKSRLMEIAQQLKQAKPVFEVSAEDLPHQKGYTCVASLMLQSERYCSAPCTGSSKKEAERLAALDILNQLPDQLEHRNTGKQKAMDLTPGTNPVSMLEEWTRFHTDKPPWYTFERSGPSHAPMFLCTCEVRVDEEVKQWQGLAMTKKLAKAQAAQAVCETLLEGVQMATGSSEGSGRGTAAQR